MPEKKTYLHTDPKHRKQTHSRWYDEKLPRNHDPEDPNYRDEWTGQQCFMCRYYIELKGMMGNDWGACSNPESRFDSRLMYEHDGCAAFDPVDNSELI